MAKGPLDKVIAFIQRLGPRTRDDDATDEELLGRFIARHEHAAFEALVR